MHAPHLDPVGLINIILFPPALQYTVLTHCGSHTGRFPTNIKYLRIFPTQYTSFVGIVPALWNNWWII